MFLCVVLSPTNSQVPDQIPSLRDDSVVCSEMDSAMTIAGDVSNTGVTTFVDEACEAVEIFSNYVPSSVTIPQADLQDIKSYFARPRLFARGTVPFATRQLVTFQQVDYSFMSTTFPQWQNRLSGVYAVRFKLNFRVQIAATPFNSGVMSVNWQYGVNNADPNTFKRNFYSPTSTNIPHVRLDIAQQTMVELSVPFLWYAEYFPVSGSLIDSNYGLFGINNVLGAAAVTGTTAPTYEVYLYLTDMELFGADNNASTAITLQSGSVVSSESKKSHLLSNGFATAATISRFIGRNIPSLSAIAGTTAWAADTASGVARYFGYSRPMLQDPPLKIHRTLYTGETNVDVPMSGFNVGVMQSNTLSVSPEFAGTDVDEMSFDFIKQQFSQICVGSVSTGNTHNQVLYAAPVSPSCMWFRSPLTAPYCNILFPASSTNLISQSGNAFIPSSVMHLASNFRMWRGGFKFRFTFAKTKFHAGRYMVSFNPAAISRGLPINYTTVEGPEQVSSLVQPYGYSMIMDLKDDNVFEFKVPYLLESPYTTFSSASGAISVVCIDPLLGPATVPTVVQFLVEVCGDSDFEINDYGGPFFVPHVNPASIYLQSGNVVSSTKETSQTTVGEKLMSVKQIIQVPWWRQISMAVSTAVTLTPPPWFTSTINTTIAAANTSPTGAGIVLRGAGNPGFQWARCYAFARGGSDVHVYPVSGAQLTVLVEQMPNEFRTFSTKNTSYTSRPFTGTMPKVISYGEHPVHARLPYFNTHQRTPVAAYDFIGYTTTTAVAATNTGPWRGHLDKIFIDNNSATLPAKVWIGAAAADDASLGHYMGPVPIYIPNVLNPNSLDGDWLT